MTKKFSQIVREEFQKYYLEEGLIASYDIDKLVEEVLKIISKKVEGYQTTNLQEYLTKTKYGRVCTANIFLTKHLSPTESSKVKSLIKQYGYTNSVELFDKLQLQLEPRYPVKLNELIEQYRDREFYHITRKKALPKIEKIGIVPKTTQTTYDHPGDRIYLCWLPTIEKKGKMLERLVNSLARNKKLKYENFAIIVTDYNPNANYYLDDTAIVLADGFVAIFTPNNIHPSAIKKVIDLQPLQPSSS